MFLCAKSNTYIAYLQYYDVKIEHHVMAKKLKFVEIFVSCKINIKLQNIKNIKR